VQRKTINHGAVEANDEQYRTVQLLVVSPVQSKQPFLEHLQSSASMAPPSIPNPYAEVHASPSGPGDARPTAYQMIKDNDLLGKMTDKTFLVTGGTDGLGLETVRTLAKTGARVFFTARSGEKAKKIVDSLAVEGKTDGELKDARIEWVQIDNMSLKSVKAGAEDFLRKSDKLNVLVANAGALPRLSFVRRRSAC